MRFSFRKVKAMPQKPKKLNRSHPANLAAHKALLSRGKSKAVNLAPEVMHAMIEHGATHLLKENSSDRPHALTLHGFSDWFSRCPRDDKGHCSTGGGGGPSTGYMAGQDKTFSAPQDSKTLQAIVKGEAPHDKYDLHYEQASSKEDTALTAIMKEAGRTDAPRLASKEEVDKLVKAGWYETYRGVGDKAHADQFKTGPEMYNGAGSYGNGTYTYYAGFGKSAARCQAGAESYAAQNDKEGKGGAVIRTAFPKDARVVDHKTLSKERDKDVVSLFDRHAKGEITKEERDKTHEVYKDLGRYGALKNYDGIKESSNNILVILNRSKCVVQRD